jgi:hypothetical protein
VSDNDKYEFGYYDAQNMGNHSFNAHEAQRQRDTQANQRAPRVGSYTGWPGSDRPYVGPPPPSGGGVNRPPSVVCYTGTAPQATPRRPPHFGRWIVILLIVGGGIALVRHAVMAPPFPPDVKPAYPESKELTAATAQCMAADEKRLAERVAKHQMTKNEAKKVHASDFAGCQAMAAHYLGVKRAS